MVQMAGCVAHLGNSFNFLTVNFRVQPACGKLEKDYEWVHYVMNFKLYFMGHSYNAGVKVMNGCIMYNEV